MFGSTQKYGTISYFFSDIFLDPIDGFENYYTEKKNEAQEEISDDNSDLLEGLGM